MTFQQAVKATNSVQAHYQSGLKALPDDHANHIQCANTRRLTGSINVDEALRATEPNAPRWDYGIGLRRNSTERAIWVEVHPASSTSICDVIKKLPWLKNWLRDQAPALGALTGSDYYWLSTDARIAITPNSPQARRLAAAGMRGPMRVLRLP